MTHYRSFNPDLDARPLMHEQYLRPEEEVLFVFGTVSANAAYDVRGRQRDGKPNRSAVLSALKSMLLASGRLTGKLVLFLLRPYDLPGGGRSVVPVTVSGAQPDCRAASLADAARRKAGVWVLTDQRFAFVEVRNHDGRQAASESDRDDLDLLKMRLDMLPDQAGQLPGEWSADEEDQSLGLVTIAPAFELTADRYHDRGRDRMKPKGSGEGVFHLLEFPDGSSIALGIAGP